MVAAILTKHLHRLTLSFRDSELEQAFAAHSLPRLRVQARAAVIVGTLVYFLYGLFDLWSMPAEDHSTLWMIRAIALIIPAAVFLLTFNAAFARANQLPLALTGLSASCGLIATLWYLPLESSPEIYTGLVLATFFTYNLVGTRFIYALIVNLVVLVTFSVVFGIFKGSPWQVLLQQSFFIIAANVIGGSAGYLAEHQRRQLFLRELELDFERKHHLQRSLHDRLTGLPNRELLEDRITQLLARSRRDSGCHAGLYIDLDGFKAVNDSLGHDRGDDVLREVALRLVATARQTDTVSRIGGDEFFVLAHDVATRDAAEQLADKLLAGLSGLLPSEPGASRLGASIGIVLFWGGSGDLTEPVEIIHQADQAMYRAKSGGKNRHAFAASEAG